MASTNIDPKLAEELFREIRILEVKNARTRRYDDKDMVRIINDRIKKRIKENLGEIR